LRACLLANPYNSFWHNTTAEDWRVLRAGYANRLLNTWVHIVAPTRSVWDRWSDLLPGMAGRPWHLISHGLDLQEFTRVDIKRASPRRAGKLRVVIPGRLAPHKGLHLFSSALPELLDHAEILLLGCGDFGNAFRKVPGVQVVPEYDRSALADEIRRFEPDCALLLSVLPESFSYTLSEMLALEIPVLATRLGAFQERIEQGITGLLFEACSESLVACIRGVAADRTVLERIAENLSSLPHRSAFEMVHDYHALLPVRPDETGGALLAGLVEVAHARQKLAEDNKRLLAEAAVLRARVSELDYEMAGLAEAQLTILHSRSWHVTAPLRAMLMMARTLKSALFGSDQKRSQPQAQIEDPLEATLERALLAEQVEIGSEERMQSRGEVRHGFGIPDAARIVFGFGPSGSEVAARRLVRAARLCATARNDICIVLHGSNVDDKSWAEWSDEVALLVSMRRLFFSWPGLSPERSLQAADVFISPLDGAAARANGLLALRAGMLLLTNEAGHLPAEVLASQQVVLLPGLDEEGCAKALASWLDLPEEEQARIASRNRHWLDG
jgi:glycosyltransferase involved in cell wall biosynthesis